MNEKVYYNASDKSILSGVINRVNVSKEIIIICHDIDSNKDSRVVSSIANSLSNYNFNNFRFDFYSVGESEGDREEFNLTKMISNLHDTMDWLNNEYGYEEFILFGCGIGGKVVSLVDREKYDVKKLILWYASLSYKNGLFNLPTKEEKEAKEKGSYKDSKGNLFTYNYYLEDKKYISYKEVLKFDVPIFFVHGSEDEVVKYKKSVKMSKKVKHGTICLIGGGDHGFSNDRHLKKAIKETVRFLD